MTQGSNNNKYGNFPDPFAASEQKLEKSYGLKYAKAIASQWGNGDESSSLLRQRMQDFEKTRDYANGTQDTSIYKQILSWSRGIY